MSLHQKQLTPTLGPEQAQTQVPQHRLRQSKVHETFIFETFVYFAGIVCPASRVQAEVDLDVGLGDAMLKLLRIDRALK